MSGWELFTWLNAGILALGSLIVFALFLRQLPVLLGQRKAQAGSEVQESTQPPDDA